MQSHDQSSAASGNRRKDGPSEQCLPSQSPNAPQDGLAVAGILRQLSGVCDLNSFCSPLARIAIGAEVDALPAVAAKDARHLAERVVLVTVQ